MRTVAKRVLPWLIAAAILAVLLRSVPAAELAAALERTSLWQLALLAGLFVTATLAADTAAVWLAVRRALPAHRLSYPQMAAVKAASYLLQVVSWGAGQGTIVYFLKQRHRIPVGEAAGAVLMAAGVFLIVVAAAVGLGLGLGAVPDSPELRWLALAVAVGVPLYLALVALRPRFLADRSLLRPLFDAGVVGTLEVAGARCAHTGILIAGHWLAMGMFGIEVPLADAIARLPVLFVIGSLPISPSGLGTVQAAAVTLFAGYAPGADEAAREAAVLAYSLAFQVLGLAGMAAWGLVGLRRMTAVSGSVDG